MEYEPDPWKRHEAGNCPVYFLPERNFMGKESFVAYLKSVSAENSGKPQAYAKAMEVIESIFFSKALVSTTDIWDFITTENIDALYGVVLREQKNDDGIFKDYQPASYWKAGYCSAALKEYKQFLLKTSKTENHTKQGIQPDTNLSESGAIFLSKPFLLLAGISGTGKTRFVREQAKKSAVLYSLPEGDNYCLVPVRPDWHEPSDLLGYISRIGSDGPRYVVTDLLRFIVAAWKHTAENASAAGMVYKSFDTVCPYWLCLDEMNLAPVEQYFADYLSILETRTWENGAYSCDSLLKSAVIKQQLDEEGQIDLWKRLGIDDAESSGLVEFFTEYGIALPPNLIVAGTVNMDETTHGFSRKVIDRALTFDFGEFFPNDFDEFFNQATRTKTLGFPQLSHVTKNDISEDNATKTVAFLKAVNAVLKETPFELAYRALNEALLSVVCFNPADEIQLQAVWDDFLMMKVLPRIEGDAEKLGYEGEDTGRLIELSQLLKTELAAIADGRPDLLRVNADGSAAQSSCRSLRKLAWMQKRLSGSSFTSFWP